MPSNFFAPLKDFFFKLDTVANENKLVAKAQELLNISMPKIVKVEHLSENGFKRLISDEGVMKSPYMDGKNHKTGYWTVGIGHLLYDKYTGKKLEGQSQYARVKEQYPEYFDMTDDAVIKLLKEYDVPKYEKALLNYYQGDFTQNQFDALFSFVFNTGGNDLGLRKLINNKASEKEIRAYWSKCRITSNKVYMPGLEKRRKREVDLFFEK